MFKGITNIRTLFNIRQATTFINSQGKDVVKKKIPVERITLIGTDNSVSITDLQSAVNLSNRRDLKLLKVEDVDTKTRTPVYKLMTRAQYHEDELANRRQTKASKSNALKGRKLITISSNIGVNDLMTTVKKIEKLLEKRFEVQVVLNGRNDEDFTKCEQCYSTLEQHLKSSGKFVQKRTKGFDLKFQIMPKRNNSETNSSPSNDKADNGPV